MSEVRRWAHTVEWEGLQISATYMAINDRGEYVMHDDYATLEAELARLHAGQEPVAQCTNGDSWNCKYCRKTESCDALKDPRNFGTPQPSAVPDGLRKVIDYPSQSLHQASGGIVPCGEEAIVECIALLEHASAPATVQGDAVRASLSADNQRISPPEPIIAKPHPLAEIATVQGVNQQLLEALEYAAKRLATITSADGSGHADIALCVLRMAGYGADERECLVEAWKLGTQWRIDAAIAAARQEGGKV